MTALVHRGLAWVRPPAEGILLTLAVAVLVSVWGFELFRVSSGSMGPTLRGRHYAVACRECGLGWEVDASTELDPATGQTRAGEEVAAVACPLCGRETELDRAAPPAPLPGDRLIVDRATYTWREPRRWEVAVFQDPERAQDRVVKRIVGLPGESIRIHRGDLWRRAAGEEVFQRLQKPPEVARELLMPVADSARHEHDWSVERQGDASRWRYRPDGLVRDVSGYNAHRTRSSPAAQDAAGLHWVPDLAARIEFAVDDSATHESAVSAEVLQRNARAIATWQPVTGAVRVQLLGPGTVRSWTARRSSSAGEHSLMLGLIDGQLLVWIDDTPVGFGEPLALADSDGPPAAGDFQPVAIETRGSGLRATRRQVFRDVYYTARSRGADDASDFIQLPDEVRTGGRAYLQQRERAAEALADENLRQVEFTLGHDECLLLGDNSPRSRDSRLWDAPPGVPRRLIVGRVLGHPSGE